MRYYTKEITSLEPNQIFVFGSNLAGRHGAGAAQFAMVKFHAIWGIGEGLTGHCYALPTKDENIETISLNKIEKHVYLLLKVIAERTDLDFIITKVGCGLAGYTNEEIAPMFKGFPPNCLFDIEWKEYLE